MIVHLTHHSLPFLFFLYNPHLTLTISNSNLPITFQSLSLSLSLKLHQISKQKKSFVWTVKDKDDG